MSKKKIILFAVAFTLVCSTAVLINQLYAQRIKGKKTTSKNTTTVRNEITLTMDGATTKYTTGVNAVIIGGKFMGITNADGSVHVGDSEKLIAKGGSVKTGAHIYFTIKGITMMDSGESCSITITYYDGKTIKGTFAADLHPDIQSSEGKKIAVGTFQTNDLLKM